MDKICRDTFLISMMTRSVNESKPRPARTMMAKQEHAPEQDVPRRNDDQNGRIV